MCQARDKLLVDLKKALTLNQGLISQMKTWLNTNHQNSPMESPGEEVAQENDMKESLSALAQPEPRQGEGETLPIDRARTNAKTEWSTDSGRSIALEEKEKAERRKIRRNFKNVTKAG